VGVSMRVLVTGNEGLIGRFVTSLLQEQGDEVVGFDRVNGYDILDRHALRSAAEGCEAIVHLAAVDTVDVMPDEAFDALTSASRGTPEDIMITNALGTQHVLSAAAYSGVRRLVFMSSVDALGIFLGERTPDYLPIDDDHPTYPRSPYALAKRLAEEMCRSFTEDTGIPTICLRPPGVFTEDTYAWIKGARAAKLEFEWSPFWEYGAFLDARDVASAVSCALRCSDPGHVVLLLCADDISSAQRTSRELARMILPDVPWRGGLEYEQDPFRALLNTQRARRILNWAPQYRWRPTPGPE
jgi:UDP-glucose 4-epimerase